VTTASSSCLHHIRVPSGGANASRKMSLGEMWFLWNRPRTTVPGAKVPNKTAPKNTKSEILTETFKGVVHFKKKLLRIIYSPPCHPRCPCLSFFSQKKLRFLMKTFQDFLHIMDFIRVPQGH